MTTDRPDLPRLSPRRVKKLAKAFGLLEAPNETRSIAEIVADVDPTASEHLIRAALEYQAMETEWQLKVFTIRAALEIQRRAKRLDVELAKRNRVSLSVVPGASRQ